MTILATVFAINGALALTLAVLAFSRLLMKALRHQLDARSEVVLLRAGLVLAFMGPMAFFIAKQATGFDQSPLLISIGISDGGGVLGAWISGLSRWSGFAGLTLVCASLVFLGLLAGEFLRLRSMAARSAVLLKTGKVTVRTGTSTLMPCAFLGLSGVEIILPAGLSARTRRSILLHEAMHVRNGDLQWNWIAGSVLLVCGWNPAFWLWRRWHKQLSEIACDRRTLDRQLITPLAYAESLVCVASKVSSQTLFPEPAAAFLGRPKSAAADLKLRLSLAMEPQKPADHRWFLGFGMALLLAVNLAAGSVHVSLRNWSVEQLESSMQQNLLRMAETKRLPAFGLILAY